MGSTLSQHHRLLLRNQYEILSILAPAKSKEYQLIVSILEKGFELEYYRLHTAEWKDQSLSESECSFVISLLNLYCEIFAFIREESIELSRTERFRANFPGLTGHHLEYAHYLIRGKSKIWGQAEYEVLKDRKIESDRSLIAQYKNMVEKRSCILKRNGFIPTLSVEDIRSLLDWKTAESE